VKNAVVLLLVIAGLALVACGGSGSSASKTPPSDQETMAKLFRGYVKAFDDLDSDALKTFYSKKCSDLDQRVANVVKAWRSFYDTVDIEISGAQVRNVEADKAEAMPEGKMIYPGQEGPLTARGFEQLVKEDGEWKFANCDFTF
jgi:hypothetical protein